MKSRRKKYQRNRASDRKREKESCKLSLFRFSTETRKTKLGTIFARNSANVTRDVVARAASSGKGRTERGSEKSQRTKRKREKKKKEKKTRRNPVSGQSSLPNSDFILTVNHPIADLALAGCLVSPF